MSILDKVVKIEKSLEKLAARKGAAPTPLEIRRAILEDIEEQVRPAGRSRRVFPYDRVTIEVLEGSGANRAELQAVLDPGEGLADAIRDRLKEAGCDRVGRLDVSLKVIRKTPPAWQAGAVFGVTYERSEAAGKAVSAGTEPGPAAEATPARPAQLVVIEGDATRKLYALTGECTNIGRLPEVTDKHRRVVRRNQVVFRDVETEANQTVSRAQAHIVFTPPDQYRLFDDRSSYGTRIMRGGRTIDLSAGGPRGVRLQPGDEIHFGRARGLFQVK